MLHSSADLPTSPHHCHESRKTNLMKNCYVSDLLLVTIATVSFHAISHLIIVLISFFTLGNVFCAADPLIYLMLNVDGCRNAYSIIPFFCFHKVDAAVAEEKLLILFSQLRNMAREVWCIAFAAYFLLPITPEAIYKYISRETEFAWFPTFKLPSLLLEVIE